MRVNAGASAALDRLAPMRYRTERWATTPWSPRSE
jgi:hypothetical protein